MPHFLTVNEQLHIWELPSETTATVYNCSPASGKFLAQGYIEITEIFFLLPGWISSFPVTSLLFSFLYHHDPLFRIIWVPQFHKASFCPDVNLRKCATWDLYEVFKATGAQIIRLELKMGTKSSFLHVLCVWVRNRLKAIRGRKQWHCPHLIPPVLQPQQTPNHPSEERGRKWPNLNRKCCKVTSSSLQGGVDGMLLWCVCVCVHVCGRQRGFRLYWPTPGPA